MNNNEMNQRSYGNDRLEGRGGLAGKIGGDLQQQYASFSCVPEEPKQVRTQVQLVDEASSRVLRIVQELEGRLSSVLRPSLCGNTSNTEIKGLSDIVPLADQIRCAAATIESATATLNQILERLEL